MKINKNYYLFEIIKPHKRIFLLLIIFIFMNGFLSSFNLIAVFPLLNSILPGTSGQEHRFFFWVQSLVQRIPIEDAVIASSLFLLSVTILTLSCSLFLQYLIGRSSSSIGYVLKDCLFKKYAAMDYQHFVEQKQGRIFYYLFTAPQNSIALFTLLPHLVAESIQAIFLIGLLFIINLKFSIFVLAFILLFNAIISKIARNISYNIGKQRKALGVEQQIITSEFINGLKQIVLYLAKPRWVNHFDQANLKLRRNYLINTIWIAIPKNFLEFSMYLFIIITVFLARNKVIAIKQLAGMAIYIGAMVRLLPHIVNVGRIRMKVMQLLPDAESAFKISAQRQKEPEKATKSFSALANSIEFRDVYFSYKDRPAVIKGLNFTLEAMKTTAIVGPSGVGKTTIINLLLKLLKPEKGQILVDGDNLEEYITESWLRNIAFVSQDPFIFHSTIKRNITFEDERFSHQDVVRAAEIAYANEFIEHFPNGYETVVGEKGMKLSAGQQQRIAIARAVIRNPQMLIFDEATSALDNISQEMIQKAISNISKRSTVIIIAHRLSTIKNADKIIVIKDGVNIEEGTHDNLIQAKGHYRQMYSHILV